MDLFINDLNRFMIWKDTLFIHILNLRFAHLSIFDL